MRKHYLLCFSILVFSFCGRAQWVSIPDMNFGTWLSTDGYSACMRYTGTEWQMDTTCPGIVNTTILDCDAPNITNLTGISYFDNLNNLNCSGISLVNLSALPAGLTMLVCDNNQLSSLPALPAGLTYLHCGNNQLGNLPALPDGLTTLVCQNNQLSSLPALPTGLTDLYCNNNQLNSLPALPTGLNYLQCGNNQLSSLPALPEGLALLACYTNQLSSLPALPTGLIDLFCNDNPLSSLPALPDSLVSCNVRNNPLNCLPQLKRIVNLNFINTNITCLPNHGNVTTSNPALNSLPLCVFDNAKGCAIFSSVSEIRNPKLEMFPNPASSTVTISIDESMIGSTAIISDITGRKMMAVELITNHQSLITASFANGVYFVTVTDTEGRSATKKLVIGD